MYICPLSEEEIALEIKQSKQPDKITVEYVPSPPPPPGKILVKAPVNERGYPIFPNLHLTPDQALELYVELGNALEEQLRSKEKEDAKSRTQGNTPNS